MLNGTWTMDPLQAGGWNNAATVRINKDTYSYSRRSAVPEEPFPPINPHAIVQAPAEDEDGFTRSLLPLPKSAGFQNKCSIVVEEHDSHHISPPPINPLAIVQAPAEDEEMSTRSKISVLDDNNQASPIIAQQVSGV